MKQRKIRFEDDGNEDEEEEKDTRLKYKHPVNPVSALQAKMLRLAGQEVPGGDKKEVCLEWIVSCVKILLTYYKVCTNKAWYMG